MTAQPAPVSPPPEPWMVKAAKDIIVTEMEASYPGGVQDYARIIAKHAPPPAPSCTTEQGELVELLTRAVKWMRRLHERRGDINPAFFRDGDPLPLLGDLQRYIAALSRQPAPSGDAAQARIAELEADNFSLSQKWLLGEARIAELEAELAAEKMRALDMTVERNGLHRELAQLRAAPSAVAKDRAGVVERLKGEVSSYTVLSLTPPEYLTDAIALLSQPAVAQTEAGHDVRQH